MKHKELDELYRENTSQYTKSYNLLFKLDLVLFPFLLLGMFWGNDKVQLYTSLFIAILTTLLVVLFSLDTYFRIKKGKQREKDEKRVKKTLNG